MGQRALSRGRFISIEGGEGAGKSTQQRLLIAALSRRGIPTLATREPGGSPGAEEIRKLIVDGAVLRWDAVTEALLISAARRDHLVRTVWPALEEGNWVISDRYADSTTAYQGFGHGLGRTDLDDLYRFVAGSFVPDLTIILDVPAAIGLARAKARAGAGEDRFERMDEAFHERLRRGFLDIARAEPRRCAVIDAAAAPERVHAALWREVERRFALA